MKTKTRSTTVTVLCATLVFTLFVGCGGKQQHDDAHQHHDAHADETPEASAPQFEVDAAFQQQLAGVFDAYINLKEAFVSSDASTVKTEAAKTQQALAAVDMKLVTGAAHNDWMTYTAGMESSLKEIQAQGDIEAQRTAFSALSDNLYKSIKAYGLGGKTAFYEFCPMAFNDEGGYWLSNESKIRNPYFGDKMLSCGVVKEKLQ